MRDATEAEASVLGLAMIDQALAREACAQLEPAMFTMPGHRAVFEVMQAMVQAGQLVDPITLYAELRRVGRAGEAGEWPGLKALLEYEFRSDNHGHYMAMVHKAYLQRRIEAKALEIYKQPTDQAIDELQELAMARAMADGEKYFSFRTDIGRVLDELDKPSEAERIVYTGMAEVDDYTGGFLPGELWTIGGRPGKGKTTLAVKLMRL